MISPQQTQKRDDLVAAADCSTQDSRGVSRRRHAGVTRALTPAMLERTAARMDGIVTRHGRVSGA